MTCSRAIRALNRILNMKDLAQKLWNRVVVLQYKSHLIKTKINQETHEPKDLIRGCVMRAPIGFRVAMLGGIFVCYLYVSKGVCVLDCVIHQPNWKVQRTHHCISEV